MALLKVRDECTKLIGHRFLNSHICLVISVIQLMVCCWAFAQHVNSYVFYSKILKCDFMEGSLPLEAVDAVIFDIRLFHHLWGIRGCVAEYLDGGFGRLAWCVSHSTSLICSIPAVFLSHPRPFYFYPLLIQQSAYGICLLVLLLAALPRIVVVLAQPQAAPLAPILFYLFGTTINFFYLYVYWHWYWHVSSMWNSAVRVKFGQRLVNANNRSRKDKPRLPKEEIDEAVLHYIPGDKHSNSDGNSEKIILPPNSHTPPSVPPPPVPPSSQLLPSIRNPPDRNNRRNRRISTSNGPLPSSSIQLLPKSPPPPPSHPSPHPPYSRRVYIMDEPEEDEEEDDEGDDGDIDDLPTPPPPIYATRLTCDSYENRMMSKNRNGRRQLPITPDLPKHGEIPAMFYLPNAQL